MKTGQSRSFVALWIALFLDLVGFGMIIPDIQLRAQGMGAPGWLIGTILASTFVVQLLVSPHWGKVSDRSGGKKIFVACQTISALAMLIYALAVSPMWLLASRIVGGLGAANVAIAQSMVAEQSSAVERAAAMGRIGAAISAGLIIGPSVGGHIAAFGNAAIGFVAAGCSLLGVIVVLLFSQEAKTHAEERTKTKIDLLAGFRLIADVPAIRLLALVAAVSWFSLAMLEGTFGRLIARPALGFGQQEFGWIFSFESLLSLIVQGFLVAIFAKKMTDNKILFIAYISLGIGLAFMPYSPTLLALFACSAFFAFGQGLSGPTLNTLASKVAPPDRQGELFGMLQSARSAGFIFGPILGGALFDKNMALPYLFAAATCMVAAVIVLSMIRRNAEIESMTATA